MGGQNDGHHSGPIEFDVRNGQLVVVDTIERRRAAFTLHGGDPVSATSERDPVSATSETRSAGRSDSPIGSRSDGPFQAPVDRTVTVRTDRIDLPRFAVTIVRDADRTMLTELEPGDAETFEPATYELELCTPIKFYLRATGGMTIDVSDGIVVEFDSPTELQIGARSKHDRPAGTVTTTADPEDLMAAISTFGSALKTTSPERSFPTLRGHPPTIELGDELAVPDPIESPDTDVRIEVPPRLESIYPVAPLAYYLGASVVPGEDPTLVADGVAHQLPGGAESGAERVLKKTFFLDCVVRTEGLYTVDLNERAVLEDRIDLPFERLYQASLGERLNRYMDVEYGILKDLVPDWKLVSRVEPTPDRVETIPYLVDDLAVVRTGQVTKMSPEDIGTGALHGTVRGSGTERSTFVRTDDTVDALEATWVGDGMPVASSKALTEAFRNRIDRTPTAESIEIAVVSNDQDMAAEANDVVDEAYGARSQLPFDVTVHRQLPTDRLAELLRSSPEFLHYVGHIDDEGFRCVDGHLDAGTLDGVGLDAFFLNACRSFEQGRELIDGGAIGGIVTLSDVVNVGAIRIGSTIARLLDSGFPLWATLDVAGTESVIGPEYTVIGDGGVTISQPETGIPYVLEVERATAEEVDISITTFAGFTDDIGGLFYPFVEGNDQHYLNSGSIDTFSLPRAEFDRFVPMANAPIIVDDRVRWCSPEIVEEI